MSAHRQERSAPRQASLAAALPAVVAASLPLVFLATLALVAGIAWLDYATGWEWDASALYALPIVLIIWRTNRNSGFALAFLCAAIWWMTRLGSHPYPTEWGLALALIVRFFFLAVVVVAAAAVKAQWSLGNERIALLERERELEREILQSSERERQRIGRDLHDGLCQTLAGTSALSLALSRRLAASSEADASTAAAEIARRLNEAVGEARDLARGLGPVVLKETDLAGALEGLARNVQRLYRISCTVEADPAFRRPGLDDAAHLFRIAQEAVNNAVTHGRADRVEIRLSCVKETGVLDVRDNGAGLPEKAHGRGGVGLHTMAQRAQLIGGSVDVRRQSGGGTAVTCVFPLPAVPDPGEQGAHARDEN
jgi:signal transduction histidine kinase